MTGVRITSEMRARGVMAVMQIEAAVTALRAAAAHADSWAVGADSDDAVWLRSVADQLARRADVARRALQ